MEDVDIEQQHTESFLVSPSGEPRPAQRAEQALVLRYRDYMAARGISVWRKKYLPADEVQPIYSDAWIEDRQVLIQAKNSDRRERCARQSRVAPWVGISRFGTRRVDMRADLGLGGSGHLRPELSHARLGEPQ
jgi:hypothetical protein